MPSPSTRRWTPLQGPAEWPQTRGQSKAMPTRKCIKCCTTDGLNRCSMHAGAQEPFKLQERMNAYHVVRPSAAGHQTSPHTCLCNDQLRPCKVQRFWPYGNLSTIRDLQSQWIHIALLMMASSSMGGNGRCKLLTWNLHRMRAGYLVQGHSEQRSKKQVVGSSNPMHGLCMEPSQELMRQIKKRKEPSTQTALSDGHGLVLAHTNP